MELTVALLEDLDEAVNQRTRYEAGRLKTNWRRTSTLDIMAVLTELNDRGMLKERDDEVEEELIKRLKSFKTITNKEMDELREEIRKEKEVDKT